MGVRYVLKVDEYVFKNCFTNHLTRKEECVSAIIVYILIILMVQNFNCKRIRKYNWIKVKEEIL